MITSSQFPSFKLGDGEVSTLIMGQSPASETYNNTGEGLPFYQGKSDFGWVHPTPRIWCSAPGKVAHSRDVLISVRAPVGDVNIATSDCCLGRGLAGIRAGRNANSIFLFFALSNAKPRLASLGTGTTFQSINKTTLEDFELPLPPLSTQEKIAAVLWKIQRAAELEEKLALTAHELKAAAMRRLFSAGLKGEPQKETEVGTVPKSWDVVPLGHLAKIGNGSTPKRTNPAYWQNGSFPWLTSAKVYDEVIQKADQFVTPLAAKECHLPLVPSDSLVVAITGQGKTLGHVARVAIDTFVSQHLAYITFSDKAVSADFMRQYLGTRYEHFRQVSQGYGSTKGALTCAFLKSCVVPIPADPDEQTAIAAALGTMDRKIAIHERRAATLRELFASLLHRLMTGEVRVDKLDIDVSEVRA